MKKYIALLLMIMPFTSYAGSNLYNDVEGVAYSDIECIESWLDRKCKCPCDVIVVQKVEKKCVAIQYRIGRNPDYKQETDVPPRHFEVMNEDYVDCKRYTRPLTDKTKEILIPLLQKDGRYVLRTSNIAIIQLPEPIDTFNPFKPIDPIMPISPIDPVSPIQPFSAIDPASILTPFSQHVTSSTDAITSIHEPESPFMPFAPFMPLGTILPLSPDLLGPPVRPFAMTQPLGPVGTNGTIDAFKTVLPISPLDPDELD